jgi:hypothetical protein
MSQLRFSNEYVDLTRRLASFGGFRKRWAWMHALAWFVILGPGVLLALILVDGMVPLPWFLLLPLFVAWVGLAVYATIVFAILPALPRVEIEHEAVVIETLHGKLDNQIIGSLQLGREVAQSVASGSNLGYSTDLVAALIASTSATIGKLDLPALVDRRKAMRDLKIAAVVVVCFVLLAVIQPSFIAKRAARLTDAYATLLDMLFPVKMVVSPGDVKLVRGKSVTLGVDVIGARRHNVRLTRTDIKAGTQETRELPLDGEHAELVIPAADHSFSYQFEYGGRSSEAHTVLVGDLPAIAAMNTELAFPAYTGMPSRTLVGRLPKISALSGTGVLVSIASTVELSPDLCYVIWQDGARQPLSVTGRFAHFSFTVDRPERATVYLTGALGKGFEMPEPMSFEIAVQRDQPPTVEVLLRTKKMTMLSDEAMHFGVNVLAEDDFGVSEVTFDYKIDTIDPLLNRPTRTGTVSRLIDPPRDRVKVTFADVFKAINPAFEPGDRITISVSAKDNNTETGPGLGRATPIEIVVVRPDLGAYVEQNFGFGSDPLLGGLTKVQRATNLLVDPTRTANTEAKAKVEKQDVKSRVGAEDWPGGSEDAVGDYFRLLSGQK